MTDVTIYTLAKELNMTPSMVSRAFNPNAKISEKKRKIVLEAAKKYNFSPNRLASRLSMKTVRIGILMNQRFPAGIVQMRKGIERAYENFKDYKVQYHIELLNPDENDLDDYQKIFHQYQTFDGVILTGMSASKYTKMIDELYRVMPNIAQVQAINMEAEHLFGSKHNEETASKLAADFLCCCLKRNERKNILLITGDMETSVHSSAEATFQEACKMAGMTLLDSIDMKDNEEYFTSILPDVFHQHSDMVDGIYMTSGFSAPLCKYLDENGIDIPFVAFDTYEDIKTYIEKGTISATISQNVSCQMETAFERLVRYLITGEIPPKIVYTDIQVVLKSNIHQFE